MTKHHVYRIVSTLDGELLYIGLTSDFHTRMTAHRTSGPVGKWVKENPGASFIMGKQTTFADPNEAARLEETLIQTLKPKLNKTWRSVGGVRLEDRPKRKPMHNDPSHLVSPPEGGAR